MRKVGLRHLKRIPLYLRTRWHLSRDQAQHITGPPIFIIGSHRSGTSLLRRIVDAHPNIACPPESKFILPLEELVKHPQALEGLGTMGFTRSLVLSRLRSFVVSFFEDYAAIKGKGRWADKTPNYVDCLPFLDELLEGTAQYVVIVRHPFDVSLSFEENVQRAGRIMPVLQPYLAEAPDLRAAACQFWNDQNRKITSFISMAADRVIAVDYELLTTYPEPVLRQIFDFLGESWDHIVLDFNRAPHDDGYEDNKVRKMSKVTANSGKFLTWPEAERLRLADVAREAMEMLGYGPHEPSRKQAMGDLEMTFVHYQQPSLAFEKVNRGGTL